MNPSERMGPLERRYRRLLRLLPADHRAARGEELLGLLLDLDQGRARPSLRQAVGVFGLALRLRLARAASLLLAAFLVAYSTEILETVRHISTGAISVSVDSQFPIRNVALALLIPSLLRLAIAVAWILNARRTTLAIFATLLAYGLYAGGGFTQLDLAVLVVLGAAMASRWPAPQPRVVLLATIPLAMLLLWTLIAPWSIHSPYSSLLSVTAVVALLGAVSRLLPHRPSRNSNDPHGPQDLPTPATG